MEMSEKPFKEAHQLENCVQRLWNDCQDHLLMIAHSVAVNSVHLRT
jgi:hypothetical protein